MEASRPAVGRLPWISPIPTADGRPPAALRLGGLAGVKDEAEPHAAWGFGPGEGLPESRESLPQQMWGDCHITEPWAELAVPSECRGLLLSCASDISLSVCKIWWGWALDSWLWTTPGTGPLALPSSHEADAELALAIKSEWQECKSVCACAVPCWRFWCVHAFFFCCLFFLSSTKNLVVKLYF